MTQSVDERWQTIRVMYLWALNVKNKNIYLGTVSHKDKVRRRAKGKVAKATRKVNR
jgi:hypothetical protein